MPRRHHLHSSLNGPQLAAGAFYKRCSVHRASREWSPDEDKGLVTPRTHGSIGAATICDKRSGKSKPARV